MIGTGDDQFLLMIEGYREAQVSYLGSDPAGLINAIARCRAIIDAQPTPEMQVISWSYEADAAFWERMLTDCPAEPQAPKAEPAWKREQRNAWRSRR